MTPAMSRTLTKSGCTPPTCPTCGGVECFERPRFYCGQLLNDKDLESAIQYVIDKNKLHNRYLVGNGVVCGLAVYCDPCDCGSVIVEAGYAIDCCGDDIVLCQAAPFNVIDYINTCFPPQLPPCNDKITQPSPCDKQPKEYCLLLSYTESPVKPVTVLNRSNGCTSAACEPSRIDETYRLDLIDPANVPPDPPSFWDNLKSCFVPAAKQAAAFAQQIAQLAQQPSPNYYAVFCQMKKYVAGLYAGNTTRCSILAELDQLDKDFPQPGARGIVELPPVYLSLYAMWALILQYLIDCLCNALLVPCAPCPDPDGVILACITVQGNCIIKICNRSRRQLLTAPALRYYFQPVISGIHNIFESLCCELDLAGSLAGLLNPREANFDRANVASARAANFAAFATNTKQAQFSGLGASLVALANPQAVTALDLVTRPLTEVSAKLKQNQTEVTIKQATTPAQAYSLTHIPLMSLVVPLHSQVELTVDSNNIVTAFRVL
jgi:hypothetical protein